jgi:hypothetical protein
VIVAAGRTIIDSVVSEATSAAKISGGGSSAPEAAKHVLVFWKRTATCEVYM